MSLTLKVECYSGHKADERPLRFTAQRPKAPTREVTQVLDQWYGVGYQCFKVLADDHYLYVLKHSERDDVWTLESFRRAGP
jgi:hypothetical protein